MILSYRARQRLRRLLSGLLPALLLILAAVICWLFWLQRFVVYTPEGVRLDFDLTAPAQPGVIPQKPTQPSVDIDYVDTVPTTKPPVVEVQHLQGYYIDPQALQTDVDGVIAQLEQLPAGTTVLLDVKNYWGYFFYSTTLGPQADVAYSIPKMDALLSYLAGSDLYAVARLPALRDYDFALNNVHCGLPRSNGTLWEDSGNCYWLDPTQEGTLSHLIQTARELRTLGFDEVVFTDFYIPQDSRIVFDADRKTALEAAAAMLVSTCTTEHFTLSFAVQDLALTLPQKHCRLYLQNVAAVDVPDVLAQVAQSNPYIHTVFLAETNDTRYDRCCVLRPLKLAH